MQAFQLAEVIRNAQTGDPDAFDTLVDTYAPRVYGFVYRLTGDRTDAEDLLQDVMLRVVRTIGRYRHDGRFEAWLFRIAANLVRDRARKRRTRRRSETPAEADEADTMSELPDHKVASPDHRLHLTQEIDELQEAMNSLPVLEREVIMLRHFSEMSFNEISQMMDAPLGTTLARAHRGLKKLREQMDPQGCKQTGTE